MAIKVNCVTEKGGSVDVGEEVVVSYAVVGVEGLPKPEILYVWVDLGDKKEGVERRRLSIFFNRETNLLVVDVSDGTKYGCEIVRRTLPPRMSEKEKRALARKFKKQEKEEGEHA